MKALIIYGSQRRSGNIFRMLSAAEDEFRAQGATIERVYIGNLRVQPCTGCMVCRNKRTCVLPDDDAQRVLALISECDVLVIGAPCYWGNIPGQLKVLFDRMVYGLIGEGTFIPRPLHKGKRLLLFSTSTTPFPFNILFNQSHGAIRALREIFRWSGFKLVAAVECGGTDRRPVGERTLRRCRNKVKKLFGGV